MPVAAGSSIGIYEIVAAIGAGGMGEVYRARDTKLQRDVALKILPDIFACDPERLTRFEREARTLAALNHPHIAHIYGFDHANGIYALAMELVEGEDLSQRIARKPLPLDEALTIARQIAEALEAAHEAGIIHRDLKPANIKVRPDGTVKVLDFGLAKADASGGRGAGASGAGIALDSPTITSPAMTLQGVILGTAAYMSPEQAKGRPADKRSDMWAFGCVLYEMLTGRRAFDGDDVSDTLAAVLRGEPEWAALPQEVPPLIRQLLRRCLEKDRGQRIADTSAVRFVLNAPRDLLQTQMSPPTTARPRWTLAAAALVASIVAATIAGIAVWNLKAAAPPAVTRFSFALGEGQRFSNTGRHAVALSPNGMQIVYVANQQLYVRSISELEARAIPGTYIPAGNTTSVPAGVTTPVFSPDGQSVAFVTLGILKKIALGGGTMATLADLGGPVFGMSWEGDTILVGLGPRGIARVPATGGTPESVITLKDDEVAHGPQLLPGGRAVLFTLATGIGEDRWDRARIVAQTLASGDRKVLIEGGTDARYLPSGHIVFARGGTLFATAFDASRLEVRSTSVPLVEGVRRSLVASNTGAAHYGVSRTGSLVYIPGASSVSLRNLVAVDRKGSMQPLGLPPGEYTHPRVSSDGTRVAYGTENATEAVVWIHDLAASGPPRRLTLQGKNRFPIWTSDGSRVAFQSDREGDPGIFWQRADGTGAAERLTTADANTAHVPTSWSPRGDAFLYEVVSDTTVLLRLFSLPQKTSTTIASEPAVLVGGLRAALLTNAVFSPDGRWIAYSSREIDSRGAVFVRPFASPGERHQVSASGAGTPMWSRDGKELVFAIPTADNFSVASVTTQPTLVAGNLRPMPRGGVIAGTAGGRSPRNWDLAPDGRLIGVAEAGDTQPQIRVVLNWIEELKQRVPTK
jgi:eukaryotic-like serine/threonine-protein kinase